ncbi:MAG: glycosyltransferase family 2 protein [Acidimicrobiales bacterium]
MPDAAVLPVRGYPPESFTEAVAAPTTTLEALIDLTDLERGMAGPAGGVRGRAVTLTLLMPVFNEEATVLAAIDDALTAAFPCETRLIVVDDGSTDRTPKLLDGITDPRLTRIRHDTNRGKGAALLTAARAASTSHVVPFDADLEYSAADVARMVRCLQTVDVEVVYGSRAVGGVVPHISPLYSFGNRVMTRMANLAYRSNISDLHTCLKLVPLDLMRSLPLTQAGFGLDTELTAWLLLQQVSMTEVPVSYTPRTRSQGKKISWLDSLTCLRILAATRLQADRIATTLGGIGYDIA